MFLYTFSILSLNLYYQTLLRCLLKIKMLKMTINSRINYLKELLTFVVNF